MKQHKPCTIDQIISACLSLKTQENPRLFTAQLLYVSRRTSWKKWKNMQILIPVLQKQPETTQTLYCRPDHFFLLITQNTEKSQSTYIIVMFRGVSPGRCGKRLQILIPILQKQPETTQTLYCRLYHLFLLIPQNTEKSQTTYSIVIFRGERPGRSGRIFQILIPVFQ